MYLSQDKHYGVPRQTGDVDLESVSSQTHQTDDTLHPCFLGALHAISSHYSQSQNLYNDIHGPPIYDVYYNEDQVADGVNDIISG